ncbi:MULTISPECIES: tetratricopeptide repeat protein [Streptosporangium]|uniref:TPR repeat protein n=1 Tax=Streptosporangium brasiliense TaxID=47480 RepID=A0ABT9QZ62_9ACTN|nr:tetratricopeptide repeat protein [Streptosporangium brasiliense]MDP9861485.1 TPR repeat protein [Streptosporangium brasiliense]
MTQEPTRDPQSEGEKLVAAAHAGDRETARRLTSAFVMGGHIDEGLPHWERAAAAGDAFSAFTLARYRKIRGDRPAAERLYRSAAETDAGCAYGLGVLLRENGDPEAARWFRRGWELGDLDCKIELGKLLAREGKLDEAPKFLMSDADLGDIAVFRWVELFERIRGDFDRVDADLAAAEQEGDAEAAAEALYPLSGMERHFQDYPGLLDEAESYYRRAAALGSAPSLVDHAIRVEEVRARDRWPEARELLLRAHGQGYDGAAYVLGVLHEQRGDLAEAERWYADAAAAGHESAQWNLGNLCRRQRRLDEAELWFRRAGESGEDVADQLATVARLREEDAVPPDRDLRRLPELRRQAEAGDVRAGYAYGRMLHAWGGASARHMAAWFRPAAEVGDAEAAFRLGELHKELREPEARDHWHRRAAELGHHEACFAMGMLSHHHKDWQESERWFVRAAEDGMGLTAMFAGKLKAQRGAYAEAEPLLRHAWEKGHDRAYGVETAGYYGMVLHRLGRPSEAVPLLRIAAERWREVRRRYDPDDLELLARMVDPGKELAGAEAALVDG